jgi:hypothetical protein
VTLQQDQTGALPESVLLISLMKDLTVPFARVLCEKIPPNTGGYVEESKKETCLDRRRRA